MMNLAGMRGLGDVDYGAMVQNSMVSNMASTVVMGVLQSLNFVIPGLGLVLGFVFGKLFGVMLADSAPDPDAPVFYNTIQTMQAAVQAKDYAGAVAAFRANPKSFWWLYYATDGKAAPVFYAAFLGDAIARHDFTQLHAFAEMVDALTDNLHYSVESARLGLLNAVRPLLREIETFQRGPSPPGWAMGATCFGVRQAEAGGYEAVTINQENGQPTKITAAMSEGGGG